MAEVEAVVRVVEQALWSRGDTEGLVHHTAIGAHNQYWGSDNTGRLPAAGIQRSVGTTGDSCDNALVESAIGLFKTESILSKGPWKSIDPVKYATTDLR